MFDYHDTAGWKLGQLEERHKKFLQRMARKMDKELEAIEREVQEEYERMTPEQRAAADRHTQEQYDKLVQRLKADGIWREDEQPE